MSNLRHRIDKVSKYVEPNIAFAGLIGFVGFPSYYFIWEYIFPQPYENLPLRVIGAMLFIPLVAFKYLPKK